MDDSISRQAVKEAVHTLYQGLKLTRTEDDVQRCIDELPNVAIPSAEPYKGMTNREVIMALFPNPDKIDGYFSFTEEWANAPYTGKERGMTLDKVIERYTRNAEYERTHGNLQGCLEFKQLAEWLKDYKRLLEQKPYDFAKWVATEIFDDMWEYNKDAFAEIACRKLAELGIVRAKGDEWELIESKESVHTCHTCKHYTSGERDGSCDSYICKGYSDWEREEHE